MPRPLGHKLSEETKAKMRAASPRRRLTPEQKAERAMQLTIYNEAKREFVKHYKEMKLKQQEQKI